MKAQDRSAACAVVAEHASGQSGHQPKHDSSSAHKGQVAEVQGGHDAHDMADYGCQQPEQQPELHNSSSANDEQLTESQGGDGAHVAAEHGSRPLEEHAGLHSSNAASKQMAQAQDGSAAPDVAEHTCDPPQKEPVLPNSRSDNGDRVVRAEKDTAAHDAVAEHGNAAVEEQHELHIISLARKQHMIIGEDSDAAHMDTKHHCKESQDQLTLQSSIAAHEQRAAAAQESDAASSAAHVEFEDEHRHCQSEGHPEGHPELHSSIPAQTSAPVQSNPALTECQTAEHHSSQAQRRAELDGVESVLDGAGSVQHSNCATSPRCKGSQPLQREDNAGPPDPAGEAIKGAQANGKLEETAEIEEVSDGSSDDYQDLIYSDMPELVPEAFSDSDPSSDTDDETAFTYPPGLTELTLRGASVPIKIPMALNGSFMESGQEDIDSADEGPLQASADETREAASSQASPQSKQQETHTQSNTASAAAQERRGPEQRQEQPAERAPEPQEAPVLGRCALRPAVSGGDACEKAEDGCAIREGQRYLKVSCTDGCVITYHFTCWRRFERIYRAEHSDFSWKSKEGVRCFTDGCPGQVKLALELEAEAGVETHRRELLRLPDQARKPRNASPERGQQERPEQRRSRRKAAVQRPVEPEVPPAPAQQERSIERPAVVPANTNIEEKQEPLPKPDRVPQLEVLLSAKNEDDDEELERLALGLKGKKEKKRREKKKEKETIPIGAPAEEEPKVSTFFEELEREKKAIAVPLDSASFPRMAGPADEPDLALGENPLWDLLISMESGVPADHLLIWHIDVPSLARRDMNASDEMHRLLSPHGRITELEIYLSLRAAAVSFVRVQDARKALFAIVGHQLERMRLHGCYLSAFPGDQEALQRALQERLDRAEAEAQHRQQPQGSAGENAGTPAVQISAAGQGAPRSPVGEAAQQLSAPQSAEGTGPANLVPQQQWPELWEQKLAAKRTAEHAAADAGGAACTEAQLAQRATEALVLKLRSELQQEQLGLSAAAKGFQCNAAAPEFSLPAKAAPSQTSLASADGLAASSAGRAASLRLDAPAFQRKDSSSSQTGLPGLLHQPRPAPIPGLEKLRVLQLAGCTNDSLASFRQLQMEGGFCIPTSELQVGPFNASADAACTALLLYETESQLLHELWRSTRVAQSEGETLMEFELMAETEPVQAHMVLDTLPTHSTGELRVPQAARGTRLDALLALLKRKASPAHTPVSAPGAVLNLNPHSKPFTPLNGSGTTTPGTAVAAAAGSQQSTAATITEAAERLTPREQRKPEAMPEQVQSTIGLKDAWQVSGYQVPSTVAQDAAASSETAGEQQGQGKGQPFKISPQSASEGPARAQSVASPMKAKPERPEPQGSPEKAPSPATKAAVASALSGIKTSPRRSIPVMMAPKLGLAPGQAPGRAVPGQQPTDSSVQVQAAGMQAAPALRQLTGQQGQPGVPGIGAQQAGGSPVRAAAKPPVPPLLLAKVPALNAGAAAQRASDAALQSPAVKPVRGDAPSIASAPLPMHSAPRQLPKPIPHRPIAPVAKPTQDAGAVPLTALMSILFPKEAAKGGPSPTQAQLQGVQLESKPADTPRRPANKASGGSSSLSEAMPSTVMQPGQQAAATSTEKRDRPQPSSAAAARDEPFSSQAACTDPLGLLKGPSTSPSNEVGPGQDNASIGKQAASATNSNDDQKEPAAPRSHAAKVLDIAKKAMPRYAPPSRPPPAASKPKIPAPVPLGPWAAGPPAALQAAPDAVPRPRLRQPPSPAATALPHRATPRETPAVARPAAATAAEVGRAGSPQSQPAAPAPQPRSRMEYRPPALPAAPSANTFPWVFGSPSTPAESQDAAGTTSSTQQVAALESPATEAAAGAAAERASRASPLERRQTVNQMCPLCGALKGKYILMPCCHFGPCDQCRPTADVAQYPICLRCQEPVHGMQRVYR